jgi:hypothetical protein
VTLRTSGEILCVVPTAKHPLHAEGQEVDYQLPNNCVLMSIENLICPSVETHLSVGRTQ